MILPCVGTTYEYIIIIRYPEKKIKFFNTVISNDLLVISLNSQQLLIGYFHSLSQYRNNIFYKYNIINIKHTFCFYENIR